MVGLHIMAERCVSPVSTPMVISAPATIENAANHTVETANKSPLQVAEEIYQYLVESGNLIKIIKSKK